MSNATFFAVAISALVCSAFVSAQNTTGSNQGGSGSGQVMTIMLWTDSGNCSTPNFQFQNINLDSCVDSSFIQNSPAQSSFSCDVETFLVNQTACQAGGGGNTNSSSSSNATSEATVWRFARCNRNGNTSFVVTSCGAANENRTIDLPASPQPQISQYSKQWADSRDCSGNSTSYEYLNVECVSEAPGYTTRWTCLGDVLIVPEYTEGCAAINETGRILVYPINRCVQDRSGGSFVYGPCEPVREAIPPETDIATLLTFDAASNLTAVPPATNASTANVQLYSDATCSGSPINTTSVPLDQCTTVFVEAYNDTLLFERECSQAGVIERIYLPGDNNSTQCQDLTYTSVFRVGSCIFDEVYQQWAVYGGCEVSQVSPAGSAGSMSGTTGSQSNTGGSGRRLRILENF